MPPADPDSLRGGTFETAVLLNGVGLLAWLTDLLERVVSGRTKARPGLVWRIRPDWFTGAALPGRGLGEF
jgi:hypothetical protein